MKKKLITTALAGTIALTSVVGLGSAAFADDNSGLVSSKAPTVEEIEAHQAQRAEKLEERLSALVEAGTITESQKADILEFFEDNAPEYDTDATKEERKATREAFKTALEEFASEL